EGVTHSFDDGPHSDAVDRAGNVTPLLDAPNTVGIERDGYQQLAAIRGGDDGSEASSRHAHDPVSRRRTRRLLRLPDYGVDPHSNNVPATRPTYPAPQR